MERVTGIEPALSAWESDRSGPLTDLTWASDTPLVTVVDRAIPGLMAHQWPTTMLPVGLPATALRLNAKGRDGGRYRLLYVAM